MRIAVSLLAFRPGRIGGTESYLRGVIPHLAEQTGDDTVTLVLFRDNAEALGNCPAERVVIDGGDGTLVRSRFLEAVTPLRARAVERAFSRLGADVAFFPQQSIFPKAIEAPRVLTVHDVQHLILPGNIPRADRLFRAGAYRRSLRRADRIIAVSNFTRRCLTERCGVAGDRITIVPHGIDVIDTDSIEPWAGVEPPYLYYPAVTHPHKNHLVLLRAIAVLKNSGAWSGRLVLSGQRTRHWHALRRAIRRLGLDPEVQHLGFLPYAQVLSIMRGAAAVVFPTSFEGFGLPALEAAQLGTPVITSRLEVFDELGVPPECRIDFEDPMQLANALAAPSPVPFLHAPITWAEAARRTLEVIRGTARDGAPGSARM